MREKVTIYLKPVAIKWLKEQSTKSGVTLGEVIEIVVRRINPHVILPGPKKAYKHARRLRKLGHTYTEIAYFLNEYGICTARGKQWNYSAVQRLLKGSDVAY